MGTSNDDLMDRLDTLERKVDMICGKLEQANGMWFLVKLMGCMAVGVAAIFTAFHAWFK